MSLPTVATLTLNDGIAAVVTFNATMIAAADYARQQYTQLVNGVQTPVYTDWKEYLINLGLKAVMPNAVQLYAQAQLGQTIVMLAPTIPALTHGTAMTDIIFSAVGGVTSPTYVFSATGLPAGLTLDSATGTLSGTPTTPGMYSVTIQVLDQALNTAITIVPVVVA